LSRIQKQTAYNFNDASVYVRKLDFQENLCEAFAKDKKAALFWRFSFGMGSFAKDFNY